MSSALRTIFDRTLLCAAMALTTVVFPISSKAATLTKLYSFCARPNCADGAFPRRGVTLDADGNLYGVTSEGGNQKGSFGVAFMLLKQGTSYAYRRIHDFCSRPNCIDGGVPNGRLIIDPNGILYGVTIQGGKDNGGVAFELIPNATKTKWKFNILYRFCSEPNCLDGHGLWGALTYRGAAEGAVYDGTSPLFGAAYVGGKYDAGVAYELTSIPGKAKRREKVIYDFCAQANCADGNTPNELLADSDGNLFGTAGGGAGLSGVLFELAPKPKGSFRYSLLHTFGSQQDDAANPFSPLKLTSDGTLIGTTRAGGTGLGGTVFSFDQSLGKETVLYSFCSTGCSDGDDPFSAGVAIDASGAIFGTASGGGNAGYGVVYELRNGTEQVLKTFCEKQGCTDGMAPLDGVTLDGQGNVFGTTQEGGKHDDGIVFEITP